MRKNIMYGETVEMPIYLHMPAFLVESELTAEERMVYTLIFNRALMSIRNAQDYINDNNQVYVIYTNEHLAYDSGLKLNKIKKAKAALVAQNLIRIEKIPESRNVRIYPMIPCDAITYKYHVSHPPKKGGSASVGDNAQSFNVDDFWRAALAKTESEI